MAPGGHAPAAARRCHAQPPPLLLLLLRLTVAAALAACAAGNGSGYPSCIDAPGHGYAFQTSAPPMSLTLLSGGVAVSGWTAGTTYQLRLSADSVASYKGFIVAPFRATQAVLGTAFTATAKAGTLVATDTSTTTGSRAMSGGCAPGQTQRSATAKTATTWTWTPPAAGTGTVTFFAIAVVDLATYWRVYLEVPEAAPAVSPTSTRSAAATGTPSPSGAPPTPSASPSGAPPTPSGTPAATSTPSGTPSGAPPTPSGTPAATSTPSGTPSGAPPTPSGTSAATGTPSLTRSVTSSGTAAGTPSMSPSGTPVATSPPGTGSPTGSASAVPPSPSGTATPSGTPPGTGTRTPSGTNGASPTGSNSISLSPAATPTGSATVAASPSGNATATVSRSGSATVAASPSGSATVAASPSGSTTATVTPSGSGTLAGSPSGSATVASTPSGSSSAAVTQSGSASVAATASGSATAAASPPTTASPPGTPSGTPSLTPSASSSGSPASTATGTGTPSGAPPTPSGTAAATATSTPGATPSETPTPSRAGSSGGTGRPGSSYRYSQALDDVMTLYWTPRPDGGALDVRAEATGQRYVSVAPSLRGTTMLGAGAAVVGYVADGDDASAWRVNVTFLRSRLQDEITWSARGLAGITDYGAGYNGAAGTSAVWFTRTLAPSVPGEDDDLRGQLGAPTGWIWAYSPDGWPQWGMHEGYGYSLVPLYPDLCRRNTTCGNRGSCTPSGTCACDAGYSGAGCGACAPLFTAVAARGGVSATSTSAPPSCVLYDATLRDSGMGVGLTVALVASAVPPGATASPANRSAFASTLAGFVASALGLAAGDVAGSAPRFSGAGPLPNVTLTFTLAGSRAAAATANSTAVQAAIAAFLAALGDPASALLTGPAGPYLVADDATGDGGSGASVVLGVSPQLVANATGGSGSSSQQQQRQQFRYSAELKYGSGVTLTMRWRVEPAAASAGGGSGDGWLHGELAFPRNAWFGIGFGDGPTMVPAHGVACEPGATSGNGARDVLLKDYTVEGTPGVPAEASLLDAPFSLVVPALDGKGWVCRFKRRMVGGAPLALPPSAGGGAITPKTLSAGEVFVTFAHGSDGKTAMGSHTSSQSGAVIVNFMTGAVTVPAFTRGAVVLTLHALAGVVAACLLLPGGSFVSRYGRGWGGGGGASSSALSPATKLASRGAMAPWYRAHWLLSAVGGAALAVSFALGVAASVTRGVTPSGAHFASAHGALSLAATVAVVAIMAISHAAVRPALPPSLAPAGGAADAAAADGAVVKPAASASAAGGPAAEARWRVWAVPHALLGVAALLLALAAVFTGIVAAATAGGAGGASPLLAPALLSPGAASACLAAVAVVVVAWIAAAGYYEGGRRRALAHASVVSSAHHSHHLAGKGASDDVEATTASGGSNGSRSAGHFTIRYLANSNSSSGGDVSMPNPMAAAAAAAAAAEGASREPAVSSGGAVMPRMTSIRDAGSDNSSGVGRRSKKAFAAQAAGPSSRRVGDSSRASPPSPEEEPTI